MKNAEDLFPSLVERWNQKESLCLAIPKLLDMPNVRSRLLQKPFNINLQVYESSEDLGKLLTESECEVYVFPSDYLPHFSDRSRLVQFKPNEIDLSRISPDFVGLKFDRLNRYFIPVSYWSESTSDQRVELHIVLAAATLFAKNLALVKTALEDLLSNELQAMIAGGERLGTVLKDSEVEAKVKSSAIRKLNLRDLVIVKEEKRAEETAK